MFSLLALRKLAPGALAICLAISTSSHAQDFIKWQNDLPAAIQAAADADQLILLHFSASWCAPCQELERFVFPNPLAIRAISNNVVPVKIDLDQRPDLAAQYNVDAIPTDVIITPAGHVISNLPSPRSAEGYAAMIGSATQRGESLKPRSATSSVHANALSRSDSASAVVRDPLEFQTDQWHSKISSTKTVSGTDFRPPSVAKTGVESPSAWRAPETTKVSGDFVPQVPSTFSRLSEEPRDALASGLQNPASLVATQSYSGGGGFRADQASFQDGPLTPKTRSETKPPPASPTTVVNQFAARSQPAGTGRKPLPPKGIDGFCPITLVQEQRWTKGDPRWGCIHRGRLYLFTSEGNRDTFLQSPDMFSPLLGGADPVKFHEDGDLVDGLRSHGVFYGEDGGPQIVVLFANDETRRTFESDPATYLATVRKAMTRLDSEALQQ